MKETVCTLLGMLVTWFAIFLIVPLIGYETKVWVLIASATVGGLITGLFVLLGEAIVENVILIVVLLVLTAILSGIKPGLGFIVISALISGVVGTITNQINQYITSNQ